MIYIEDIDFVLIYNKMTQSIGGGTCWHNARWNVGIRDLMNDFFFVDKLSLWMDPFRSTGAGRSHEHKESILERSTWPGP